MKRRRENRGFTLIELLVVTAIVAILASFLVPAIAKAKDRAKQLTCLSNLHQLGLAVHMYGSDFGFFPPCWTGASDWSYTLKPYLEKVGTLYSDPNERSPIIVCPSRTLVTATLQPTYAANKGVMASTPEGIALCPIDHLRRPSEIIIMADATQDASVGGACYAGFDFGFAPSWTSTGNPTDSELVVSSGDADNGGIGQNVRYRHLGSANFLYADGHAGSIGKDQLKQKNVMMNY